MFITQYINHSIRTKILFWASLTFILSAFIIIIFASVSLHGTAIDAAQEKQLVLASDVASKIGSDMIYARTTVSELSHSLSGIRSADKIAPRNAIRGMLKDVLVNNPSFIQIYTTWEPDQYDNFDSAFAGVWPYDAQGRFELDWYYEEDGKVAEWGYEPGDSTESSYITDWYTLPKEAGHPLILEPYIDDLKGKSVLMTSAVAPVIVDEQVIGVIGVDISLDYIQGLTEELITGHPTWKIMVVSPDGIIAGDSKNPDTPGTEISTLITDTAVLDQIASQEQFRGTFRDASGEMSVVGIPLSLDDTGKKWTVLVQIPLSDITQSAFLAVFQMVIVAGICVIAGISILYVITGKVTSHLTELVGIIRQMREGNLDITAPVRTADEIGILAGQFNDMASHLQNHIRKISENLTIQEKLNAEIMILSDRFREGKIDEFLDEGVYQGQYLELVRGINLIFTSVREPVHEAIQISHSFAQGDFSVRFNPDIQVAGEFASFRDSLNQIGENTGIMLEAIQAEIHELISFAKRLQENVATVSGNTEILATYADDVSSYAREIDLMMKQVLTAMSELSETVGQITTQADHLRLVSDQQIQIAATGKTLAGTAEEGMNVVQDSVSRSHRQIQDISQAMDQIQEITGTIQEFSIDTNLLALNASLEAARAGKAGAGFAVVAHEVKGLAHEAGKSADHIQEIITLLSHQMEESVATTAAALGQVKEGQQAVHDAIGAFQEIISSVQNFADNTREISLTTGTQNQAADTISRKIQETSGMISRTAEAADQSAKSTLETTSIIQNIALAISQLYQSVERVEGQIERFKVK